MVLPCGLRHDWPELLLLLRSKNDVKIYFSLNIYEHINIIVHYTPRSCLIFIFTGLLGTQCESQLMEKSRKTIC